MNLKQVDRYVSRHKYGASLHGKMFSIKGRCLGKISAPTRLLTKKSNNLRTWLAVSPSQTGEPWSSSCHPLTKTFLGWISAKVWWIERSTFCRLSSMERPSWPWVFERTWWFAFALICKEDFRIYFRSAKVGQPQGSGKMGVQRWNSLFTNKTISMDVVGWITFFVREIWLAICLVLVCPCPRVVFNEIVQGFFSFPWLPLPSLRPWCVARASLKVLKDVVVPDMSTSRWQPFSKLWGSHIIEVWSNSPTGQSECHHGILMIPQRWLTPSSDRLIDPIWQIYANLALASDWGNRELHSAESPGLLSSVTARKSVMGQGDDRQCSSHVFDLWTDHVWQLRGLSSNRFCRGSMDFQALNIFFHEGASGVLPAFPGESRRRKHGPQVV